jgi:hypothetical protein
VLIKLTLSRFRNFVNNWRQALESDQNFVLATQENHGAAKSHAAEGFANFK